MSQKVLRLGMPTILGDFNSRVGKDDGDKLHVGVLGHNGMNGHTQKRQECKVCREEKLVAGNTFLSMTSNTRLLSTVDLTGQQC